MTSRPTCGIVACGGQSTRMQKDKAFINYHGEPQVYYAYRMLQPFCTEVFISCSADQLQKIDNSFNTLPDDENFRNRGPAAALLTAITFHPDKNFLMLGCDYPFLSDDEFSRFAAVVDNKTFAAAFFNNETQLYEPLIAYYAQQAAKQFLEHHSSEAISLQQFLVRNNALKYYPQNALSFKSVDAPEQEADAHLLLRHLKNE
jgi:molybdopterin-guanine dinucleotide biosynthesis protein A